MENPWHSFNPKGGEPKFHHLDRAHAQAFNKGQTRAEYKLAEHLEPFPYLGNPLANIFVLLANPGTSDREDNPNFQMNPVKAAQNRRNLVHKDLDSFRSRVHSPENPELESEWLKPRIRKVVEATSPEQVAQGFFLVNFHAYHSRSWHTIPYTFETQRYSFHLVIEAIKRGSLIIMSRNMLGWFTAIPDLYEYKNRIMFKSSRSVHISENNLGTINYRKLLNRL
jgi:hypothetical protein